MALFYWVSDVGVFDGSVHQMLVLVEEGWDADQHFVEEDAEGPPVNCVIVTFAGEHFGRKIFSSAAE